MSITKYQEYSIWIILKHFYLVFTFKEKKAENQIRYAVDY